MSGVNCLIVERLEVRGTYKVDSDFDWINKFLFRIKRIFYFPQFKIAKI